MEEEGGTGDCLDVHLVIIALLRQQLPQEAHELSGQRLDAGEGTDEHEGARVGLPHQLQRHPRPDRPPHHDHVLLLEAQPGHDVVVDVGAVVLDGFGGGGALVEAVAAVLHGEDVDLGGAGSTW